ncbi:MAG: hypothetical protein QOG42_774 [Solirubrobacteraceae bacterium]|nr:hypothetical protein [Solirubrobacteraceae bacterium]
MAAHGIIARSQLRRLALASLPGVAVLLLDPELRITGCVGSVAESYGLDAEDLLGKGLDEVLTPASYRRNVNTFRLALDGQTGVFDVSLQWFAGRTLELKTAPLLGDHGDVLGVIAVSRDVGTERIAQETLRDSERHYRLLVEESTDLISRMTPDGTYLWVSPSVEQLFGRRPSELVGRSLDEFLHPGDRDGLKAMLARLAVADEELRPTYRFRHRDGRWFWVETVLRAVRDPRTHEILEIVGAGRDVTARVIAETALERSNADLGHFAAIASHDLSEPLLLIRAYADLLEHEASDRLTAEEREHLEVISRSARKMQALIDTLLSYAAVDRTTAGLEPVDMARVVDDTLAILQARISSTGAVVARGPLVPVPGDARLLGLLVQNLLSNAMKFCERPPLIHISCQPAPGGWQLVVADNGIGMSQEDRRRIFGMFERVGGARHPGLGLGLATAHRIAETHGGSIQVDSEVGVGSTFRVLLTTRR